MPLFSPTTDADRATLRVMARTAWGTFTALALPLGLLGVAAYFASRPYFLAQLSPFRVQAAVLLAAHTVFCLLLRRPRWAAVFAALTCFNVWAVLRPTLPSPITVTDTTRPPIKILFANVLTSNDDPARLLALIAAEAPDFIALVEVNRRWQTQLEPALAAAYPFSLFRPREDNFGVAVLSRVEPAGGRVEFFADVETPSLDLTLPCGDRPSRVLVRHPLPPGGAETAALRDQHLEGLADWMRFTDTLHAATAPRVPVLILGDFNATPWCSPLRHLLASTGLHTAARGHAVVASTWPVPIPFLRIPLDHALLNEELACIRYRVGPDIGSDHFPLLLEVLPTAPLPSTPPPTP